MDSPCLFPSTHKRFAITVGSPGGGIDRFDVTPLAAGGYLNWGTRLDPSHPTGMDFYQMIRLRDLGDVLQHRGPWPNQDELLETVEANPASAWIISNEAEYRWSSDSATPEEYSQTYHDLYSLIKGADPSAQIAINAVAAVTPLRLAWLDRAWSAYRDLYGTDMPVDIWTIHNYVVNEMVHEWGIDLPKGFSNAVGYGAGTWTQMDDPAASGGTVHRSRDPGARAYFAFSGDHATLYLRTGPSSGIATIYLDKDLIDTVDLYAPQPGGRTLSYDDLPADHDPQFADRHHLRVQVTGQHNPASGDTWIQVDALEAPSTAGLPQGRLEDDDPLQAQVVVSADSYDDLDTILAQIRTMRGWMANHGQQHKPLINTEYGVIIGEDLGFDYGRVRDFMLDSFDLFLDDQAMVDPAIGMPEDGGRLLQQWFWFILAMRHFDGALIHTGLYDPRDHLILPLGQDYGAYLGPLVSDYADLETTLLTLKPGWPLFAGEP
ncbi:MAG: hypothetical protein ACK2U9_12840, partial [Anaerolineae bacterium]